jgi:hypothetical protein
VEEQVPILAGRFYGGADYLYWWTKGQRQPPLVTTGPNVTLTGSPFAAALGVPGTVVLFGDKRLDDQARSGYRFTAGYWLDPVQTVGIEATGFYLSPKGSNFAASSDGTVILARPYINTSNMANTETSFLVAAPPGLVGQGSQAGSIVVTTRNELWGAEANARIYAGGNCFYRADVLAGFRYLQVKDDLNIGSVSSAVGPNNFIPLSGLGLPSNVTAGTLAVSDRINTENDYYGGQVGARIELRKGGWFADFTGKLALGVMHQQVDINGTTTATNVIVPPNLTPVASAAFPGGLFAQPGLNQGKHSRDEFGIVVEAGFNVGYQFGEHLKTFVGYSVLYFRSDVVRPATQVDRLRPAGPPSTFNFRDQDFWAQGLNAGLEFSF